MMAQRRRKNAEIERFENPETFWQSPEFFMAVAGSILGVILIRMGQTKGRCMAIYGAQHAGEGTPEEIADRAAKECKGKIF